VDIELLVVADCPNERPAADLLRATLDGAGLTRTAFTITVVVSQEEAERRGFTGSPTFLVDGVDPFAEPDADPGLSCRLYRAGGAVVGLPSATDLARAVSGCAGPGDNQAPSQSARRCVVAPTLGWVSGG